MIFKNILAERTSSFQSGMNGIQIVETADSTSVYNDPFCSTPLFVARDGNETVLFSNFDDFYTLSSADRSIDDAGFWEILLFGTTLWTRTLYKSVLQVPAATKLVFDKKTSSMSMERYWDFGVKVDESINTMDKAVTGLNDRLDDIFSRLDKGAEYVMGLSGGLDSRVALAYLSRHIERKNLEFFTFGFDERILEYKYARELTDALGLEPPRFHKLSAESYKKALEYLPRQSGGQISIGHCHILDYLKTEQERLRGKLHLSAYYTDAVFGWACGPNKKHDSVLDAGLFKTLEAALLAGDIKQRIEKDIGAALQSYDPAANFSNVDEYKYVAERNPKFHMYLGSLQNQALRTTTPFANVSLLQYMLSVPIEFRANKRVIDRLLETFFPSISLAKIGNVSSRFQKVGGDQFSGTGAWRNFRLLNRANAILRVLTRGRLEVFNKFQTEEQERILQRNFQGPLREATALLLERGLLSREQKALYDKIPLGSRGVQERLGIVSLKSLV